MKIAFRTDASIELGSGHVMRCLTLADVLRKQGAIIRFICRKVPGNLGEMIVGRGYELAWLPESKGLRNDADDTHAVLTNHAPWDWLVVDHYALDAEWELRLRDRAGKILAIDDVANRPHDCDLLLDQNLQEPGRYTALVPRNCRLLIGPKYALLRPQFAAARRKLRTRDGRVSRLLVFFGGADAGGETLKALSAITMLDNTDISVDVIIGQTNPHRAAIEAVCRDVANFNLHCQVEDMAALMAAADLFVGAGGTSSWERCCMGLPAVVLATADNQFAQSEALAHAGAQLYLGPAEAVTEKHLAKLLEEVMRFPRRLKGMAELARQLVDGLGTGRVLAYLQP